MLLKRRNIRPLLLGIYGAALLYYVLKLVYFAIFVGGFPDEGSHISYVIQMARSPALIPDFATMPRYFTYTVDGNFFIMWQSKGEVNYLGHPPLYYLFMTLFGRIEFRPDEVVAVDVHYLRMFNIALTSVAVTIAFSMGLKRLKDRPPLVHALYAAAVVTLPELGYVGAAISNDNMAFFAYVLFFAGLLRYDEGKLDLKTYLLIGIGFFLGSFSKLTTALVMLIALFAALVVSIVRTKSLKLIANRYFLVTLPCYLAFLAYELVLYKRIGAWQPSIALLAPEFYKTTIFYVAPEDRVPMGIFEYFRHFAGSIAHSWSSLYGHDWYVNETMDNSFFGLVYWVPVAGAIAGTVVQYVKKQADRWALPVVASFLGALAYHFYTVWSTFLRTGYSGGIQARYYLFLIVPFALIMCERIPPLFRTKAAKRAGAVLALLLIAAWLAGDAPRLFFTYFFDVPY